MSDAQLVIRMSAGRLRWQPQSFARSTSLNRHCTSHVVVAGASDPEAVHGRLCGLISFVRHVRKPHLVSGSMSCNAGLAGG